MRYFFLHRIPWSCKNNTPRLQLPHELCFRPESAQCCTSLCSDLSSSSLGAAFLFSSNWIFGVRETCHIAGAWRSDYLCVHFGRARRPSIWACIRPRTGGLRCCPKGIRCGFHAVLCPI